MKRMFIKVKGIVQGVGFRPFVYNLSVSLNLKGWVNNNSEGVYIDLEGDAKNIEKFIITLKKSPPPLSKIENIEVIEKRPNHYKTFFIKKSERNKSKITLISPDIATCNDCLNDIKDPNNRRYRYPFTNCTNCGPRFSIIKHLPYDRDKTTMKKFKMCNDCYIEYTDPSNRRFHAQPNACGKCGPSIFVLDKSGKKINCSDPIIFTQQKLKEGKIFAIKGLCGFHLVCDASNNSSIDLLRKRKNRPDKPFAVMIKDLKTVKKYCNVNNLEEEILTGIQKPIVLLKKKAHFNLPYNIAPNQNTLGVMLPYTPLHTLLFENGIEILIMTSANISGLPLEYDNEAAFSHLNKFVDYFLMHNRDIYVPVDDSVVRVVNGKVRIIRRARGYVPQPIIKEGIKSILACGPNMKNTFCIAKENFLFMSQHNGDLENFETIEHYKRNVEHFKRIFSFKPQYIAYDLHPEYASTKYANTYPLKKIGIQHHHAHIVSCMVENNINTNVIGVSYDGTGYGLDNKIWGGEFLICNTKNFKREAHIDYVNLPNGDIAVKQPWRMGVSYIYKALNEDKTFLYKIKTLTNLKISTELDIINMLYGKRGTLLYKMIDKQINSIETSSMGRLFDAASSIIGIRDIITYEGQASIELENSIPIQSAYDKNCSYSYDIIHNGTFVILTYKIIEGLLIDKLTHVDEGMMAYKFHNTIINFTAEMCKILREKTKLNSVVLSGGVFQNEYILINLTKQLVKNDFKVYTHSSIPTNDGGISLGQIIIANEKLKNL